MNTELRNKLHKIIGNKCSAFINRVDCTRIDVCVAIEREIKEEIDKLLFEPKTCICVCGHDLNYHNTLTNNACHLMSCNCKEFRLK